MNPTLPLCSRMNRIAFCVLAMCVAAGCGDNQPERVPVSGTITLDGQPLATGAISFLPTEKGASAGTTFQQGEFSIDRNSGPSPGRYRVEIDSYQSTGRKIADSDLFNRQMEETRQVVPPRYNRQSELFVDVTRDAAQNRYTFDLKAR